MCKQFCVDRHSVVSSSKMWWTGFFLPSNDFWKSGFECSFIKAWKKIYLVWLVFKYLSKYSNTVVVVSIQIKLQEIIAPYFDYCDRISEITSKLSIFCNGFPNLSVLKNANIVTCYIFNLFELFARFTIQTIWTLNLIFVSALLYSIRDGFVLARWTLWLTIFKRDIVSLLCSAQYASID